ncbi:MAG TPA: tripartite tricarboxylate transporter TctB family protein [Castellaniella sp.]|uniref:tripartite tricarboxylate transporter TctB family protein n=1 Tax=Castellaniella sp. TaxID=1955812 RepID=UPI002EF6570A
MTDELKDERPAGTASGIGRSRVDQLVAIGFVLLGLAVAWSSYKLGCGWTEEGMQSGYFPFRVGLLMAIVGLGLFWRLALRRPKDTEQFTDISGVKRIAKVLIPTIIYVSLIKVIGIYESSLPFILYFILVIGKQPIRKALLISVISVVSVFVLFEIVFSIPLPKGYIEHLMGY